jgi:hypothetical protein
MLAAARVESDGFPKSPDWSFSCQFPRAIDVSFPKAVVQYTWLTDIPKEELVKILEETGAEIVFRAAYIGPGRIADWVAPAFGDLASTIQHEAGRLRLIDLMNNFGFEYYENKQS